VIRDNMGVFKRNGFDFVEREHQQQQQQQQPWGACLTAVGGSGAGSTGVKDGATPALAVDGDSDVGDNHGSSSSSGELLLACVPLLKGGGSTGGGGSSSNALGEETLLELLELLAAGEGRSDTVRPKR
jgi:hypothetical protein